MCFITLWDSGPHHLVDVRAKRSPRKPCSPCRGHWGTHSDLSGPRSTQLETVGGWGHLSIVKSVQARSDLPFGLLAPGDGKEASTFSNSLYGVC